MLRAPQVSLLTLCPLAQPEKAIGHESQIEPWLALTTTLLDASETDERRYARKMNLENRENRGSSYQYMGWMSERISLGGVFFLDIPSYRTMLPDVPRRWLRNVNHKQPVVTKDGLDRLRILPKSPLVGAVRFESHERPES